MASLQIQKLSSWVPAFLASVQRWKPPEAEQWSQCWIWHRFSGAMRSCRVEWFAWSILPNRKPIRSWIRRLLPPGIFYVLEKMPTADGWNILHEIQDGKC